MTGPELARRWPYWRAFAVVSPMCAALCAWGLGAAYPTAPVWMDVLTAALLALALWVGGLGLARRLRWLPARSRARPWRTPKKTLPKRFYTIGNLLDSLLLVTVGFGLADNWATSYPLAPEWMAWVSAITCWTIGYGIVEAAVVSVLVRIWGEEFDPLDFPDAAPLNDPAHGSHS